MNWNDFRIEFDAEGHLRISGWHGWREPICGYCGEPIQWVLDMMSFAPVEGGQEARHAACAWTPEGFDRQRERAERSMANETERHFRLTI